MIDTLRSLLSGGSGTTVVRECRTCGRAVENDRENCPTCGDDGIATYEL